MKTRSELYFLLVRLGLPEGALREVSELTLLSLNLCFSRIETCIIKELSGCLLYTSDAADE